MVSIRKAYASLNAAATVLVHMHLVDGVDNVLSDVDTVVLNLASVDNWAHDESSDNVLDDSTEENGLDKVN